MMDFTIAVPVIVAIVSGAKLAGFPSKYSFLLSMALGATIFYFMNPVPGFSEVFEGIIAGLSASGLYSGTKSVLK